MTAPQDRATIEPRDTPESWPIRRHEMLASGRVMSFVRDEIEAPDGSTFSRQWCTHPGAVAVIALNERDEVAVVHQYRHPAAMKLVEPPAGLLDHDHEDWLLAAQRELAEEALLAADDWRVLVDILASPGGVQESIRIYLARGLHEAPRPDGFVVEDEEADMGLGWLGVDTLVEAAFAGDVQSPTLVAGVLALQTARLTGRLDTLRRPDAPWPAREVWQQRTEEIRRLEQ